MFSVQSRRTPYDDEYGSCDETATTLLIDSGNILSSIVTGRLGLEPTGMPISPLSSQPMPDTANVWALSSVGRVASRDLRRHLDWLLEKLSPLEFKLRELQLLPQVRMCVRCVWFSVNGQGGPTLWPEQMERLADLNLECGFDFYYLARNVGEQKEEGNCVWPGLLQAGCVAQETPDGH